MNDNVATTDFPNTWREVLNEMEREWDRLHLEITQLRAERDQLAKALLALMADEVPLNKEEILAQIGQEKPIRELLEEMRSQVTGS